MAKTKHFVIPGSDNDFLSDILFSIKKRSKSLRYRSSEISVERVFEEVDGERLEKVELEIQPSSGDAKLLIEVWQDRWVVVSCSERTKVQKWDWFYEGKLLPVYNGKAFVGAVEATRSHCFEMNSRKVSLFSRVWQPLLAKGPELVK